MEQTKKKTFTENMRLWFKGILDPLANLLIRIGLTPTAVTLTGVVGNHRRDSHCERSIALGRDSGFTHGSHGRPGRYHGKTARRGQQLGGIC
jgi:hypothetical protein